MHLEAIEQEQARPWTLKQRMDYYERMEIQNTLELLCWNMAKTARVFGITRTTLWRKMKRLGIERKPKKLTQCLGSQKERGE